MGPNIVIGIAFILAGALIAYAGYQIRFKGRLNLIAGYDPNRVHDKEGLGTWVGNGLIALGIMQVVCGFVGLSGLVPLAGLAFFTVTVIVPVILISRISRFTN